MPAHKLDTDPYAPWNHLSSKFFMHIGNLLAELEAAYKEADILRGTELEAGGILVNPLFFINRDIRLTPDCKDPYVQNMKIRRMEDLILWELFEHRRKFLTE